MLSAAVASAAVLLPYNTAPAAECGQPVSGSGAPALSDCLYILQAAIGTVVCDPECACAVKGTLPASAQDALLCVKVMIGLADGFACPCAPPTTATTTTLPPDPCGNGTIDAPGEDCDGTNLGGETCKLLGWDKGQLSCTGDCRFDEDRCVDVAKWSGNWQSYDVSYHGKLSANLEMDAFGFEGSISVGGSPCFSSGTLSGEITGSSISSGAVFAGGQRASFDGSIDANCMRGSYAVLNGECAGDGGSWELCKAN